VFSGRSELAGEWVVSKPIDAEELRRVVRAAVRAGRSRLLVVGREKLREGLEPALTELGIELAWETDADAVAKRCAESRFEVAVVDVGVGEPQKVLDALDLRGRRLRRAVILCSDDGTSASPTISGLGMEVVPVAQAASALTAVLERQDG
jgi:hypothetical protein